jgi:hypothetical protein
VRADNSGRRVKTKVFVKELLVAGILYVISVYYFERGTPRFFESLPAAGFDFDIDPVNTLSGVVWRCTQ